MTSELTRLLQEFVAFRTTSDRHDQQEACLHWITHTFFRNCKRTPHHGAHRGAPYLWLPHPHPKLLWFAHIDVVPGIDEQFTLRIDGDRLHGRGAKDMKGGALPFLVALREAFTDGDVPISILLTSDEEIGGDTIPTLLDRDKIAAPVAFTPDTGSAPWIVTGHKGVFWADLRMDGKSAHAAMPWLAANPIPDLCASIAALGKRFPNGTSNQWQLTVTPTQLSAGQARNQTPSHAACTLDIRYPPEQYATPEDALAEVRSALPKECIITIVTATRGLHTDPQHPAVRTVQRIAQRVLGTDVPCGSEHGASDARYFGERGIPAFLFGPYGEGLHGPDEWVSLSSLQQHVEINSQWITELRSE